MSFGLINMETPFFSIIIPTYKAASTLSVAIESILSQEASNYEVLIIDGCSTDNTVEVANSYNDHRIKIESQPDAGIYDAMNKGIKLARGEWIYFLGADDYLYDRKVLETLMLHFSPTIDVVYGNVSSTRWEELYDGEFNLEKIIKQNICHQSIFVRRNVFEKVGLFDLDFKVYADWEHNWRWFFNESINHKYVSLTVAEYADGGYSSTSPVDPQFHSRKDSVLKSLMRRKDWVYYMNKKMARKENEIRQSSIFGFYVARAKRLIFLAFNKYFIV